MNAKEFKDSISKGRLQLTTGEKFTHYFIVILFSAACLMGLYFMATSTDDEEFARSLEVILFCIPVAVILYLIQKRRTRFVILKTNLSGDQVAKIVDKVALQQKWKPVNRNISYYIANSGDKTIASWGERITILYFENKIYFSSICDPEKRASISAWGRNWHNLKVFKQTLKLFEEEARNRMGNKTAS